MPYYCYLLCTTTGSHTYIGATIDPDRRLDQHNGKKAGGARATGIQVARGCTWRRVCVIEGIPEWRSALQLEWRWKQLSRQERKSVKNPLSRRLLALHRLLALEKPTLTAIPYDAYPDGPPRIRWENPEEGAFYCHLTGSKPVDIASDPTRSSPSDPSGLDETESIPLAPSSLPLLLSSPPHPVGVDMWHDAVKNSRSPVSMRKEQGGDP